MIVRRRHAQRGIAAVLGLALFVGPAGAQMMLPGANNGNVAGTPPKEGGGSAGGPTPTPPKPIVIRPPSEDTILGHALSRDGKSGAMTFDKADGKLALTKLKVTGDKISKPQETCSLDVALEAPIVATPAGRPAGALRFDVPLDACPFTIDILDGAALVSRAEPSCDFKAADCRVTPGGLWGPAAVDISAKQASDLEHQRVRIETTMRANFRALLRKAGKDRTAVKAIARDQAAFSSQREMMCRDYDQEPVHGFCSTQITQARALELLAKFGVLEEPVPERKKVTRAKPKPGVTAKAPGTAASPAPARDTPPSNEPAPAAPSR